MKHRVRSRSVGDSSLYYICEAAHETTEMN